LAKRINGGELFERVIDDHFTLTERLCELYVMQICDGINFMHKSNVLHLDMKVSTFDLKNPDKKVKIVIYLAGEHSLPIQRRSSAQDH
jgi:serine/threonine protein kinase